MAQASSVFGQIDGHPVGAAFGSRAALREAGLHRHDMAGISGNYGEGADAIVVSGGYVDDIDDGDRIVYTGQGGQDNGRQVRDQELTRGNLALTRSEERGLPVRVIRGSGGDPAHSPAAGYRYDGLYVVTSHWQEHSVDGPLIWRYVLERADGGSAWQPAPTGPGPSSSPPPGSSTPGRAESVVQRIVRNSAITQWVKDQHEDRCQICGITLETPSGRYSEGAHIRALGQPHNGPDDVTNVLCLCPNDHVLLDKGALYLRDGAVYDTATKTRRGPIRAVPGHEISWDHAAYHREHFAGILP